MVFGVQGRLGRVDREGYVVGVVLHCEKIEKTFKTINNRNRKKLASPFMLCSVPSQSFKLLGEVIMSYIIYIHTLNTYNNAP